MKAKKSNKAYNIEPSEVKSFQAQGYDIYDDTGKIIAYGAGKTISIDKYLAVVKENETLKEQIASLAEKLEKKAKKTKKEGK